MTRRTALLYLVLLGAAAAAVLLALSPPSQRPNSPAPQPNPEPDETSVAPLLPVPAYTETPFLNVGPDEKFIGSAACAGCHESNHKSYLLTPHSRALCDVNPADEPPDYTFENKASGRTYSVFRRDGKLWHSEVLKAPDGREIARTELPLRYRVGSGHFTRTYGVELDGFVHESPITWYKSKKQWDVSPGYDVAQNPGFERPLRTSCIMCHAGRWETTAESDHQLTFHEQAIGCESCHGPGGRHQELHRTKKAPRAEQDFTIVHPGKLSRSMLESICASCHLSTTSSVFVRGRPADQYRPGRPLHDIRVHFVPDRAADKMTVVGHVEQLRASKCYTNPTLTCTSCHDPHERTKPADPVAYYRQKCLDCHQQKPCSVPEPERRKQSAADDCAKCHMPQSDTDIQHVAFTHHRIGKHKKGAQPPGYDEPPDLVLFEDNPLLGAADRHRNLGMAYKSATRSSAFQRFTPEYKRRAWAHLHAAYRAGARDAEMLFGLADLLAQQGDLSEAVPYAREALAAPGLNNDVRAMCLEILAHDRRRNGNKTEAVQLVEQIVRARRFGDDWRLLGDCFIELRNYDKAATAFRKSVEIRPFNSAAHLGLAECYRQLGDETRANEASRKGEWLQRNRPD